MITLKKEHATNILIDILVEVFKENGEDFPTRFDRFGSQLANKLYQRFKYIEGNPVVFEKTMGLETLPLVMNNTFELADR